MVPHTRATFQWISTATIHWLHQTVERNAVSSIPHTGHFLLTGATANATIDIMEVVSVVALLLKNEWQAKWTMWICSLAATKN